MILNNKENASSNIVLFSLFLFLFTFYYNLFMKYFNSIVLAIILTLLIQGKLWAYTNEQVEMYQTMVVNKSEGERIAFWAEKFLDTPYDTDPLGEYVRNQVIVADKRVDCMYLTFRVVELALSATPEEAIQEALKRRFFTYGSIVDNKVVNYSERYRYAMDMIVSRKWGREVTEELGPADFVEGSRGWDKQPVLLKKNASQWIDNIESGDIIYFVKPVNKRVVGEIIGHLGIADRSSGKVYVIHASGQKKKGSKGKVKKVIFNKYLNSVSFIGVKVTRF